MNSKPWYKSKTIWVGIVEIIAGVALGISEGELAGAVGITVAVCGAVQAILRLVTGESLTKSK